MFLPSLNRYKNAIDGKKTMSKHHDLIERIFSFSCRKLVSVSKSNFFNCWALLQLSLLFSRLVEIFIKVYILKIVAAVLFETSARTIFWQYLYRAFLIVVS